VAGIIRKNDAANSIIGILYPESQTGRVIAQTDVWVIAVKPVRNPRLGGNARGQQQNEPGPRTVCNHGDV
jgi:hypothetical protein